MPAHQTGITTIEAILALPEDGLRHELLDGEHVVTPAPALPHQVVVQALLIRLHHRLEARDDVQLLHSPADIVLGPQTLVQPDVFVVAKEPGVALQTWSDVGVPLVAIEVLSPSTAARDRGRKRRIYQNAGVGQYLIVDIDARIIERWLPSDERPEIFDTEIDWTLDDGSIVTVDIQSLFERLGKQRGLPARDPDVT